MSDRTLKRLSESLVVVLLAAGVAGILGYAAATSYAAILRRDDIDPIHIAEHSAYVVGACALIVVFILLAVHH